MLHRTSRRCSDGWDIQKVTSATLSSSCADMKKAKFVTTLGEDAKEEKEKEKEEQEALPDSARAHLYGHLAARANYMTLDRSDRQFAVKEMCRGMAKPTLRHWLQMKRLARYLKGRRRAVSRFPYPALAVSGEWIFRLRLDSGGALMSGAHRLKSWSSTQRNVTLCSAEAEVDAAVKTCSECIGMSQLALDWGKGREGREVALVRPCTRRFISGYRSCATQGQWEVEKRASWNFVDPRVGGSKRHLAAENCWSHQRRRHPHQECWFSCA